MNKIFKHFVYPILPRSVVNLKFNSNVKFILYTSIWNEEMLSIPSLKLLNNIYSMHDQFKNNKNYRILVHKPDSRMGAAVNLSKLNRALILIPTHFHLVLSLEIIRRVWSGR